MLTHLHIVFSIQEWGRKTKCWSRGSKNVWFNDFKWKALRKSSIQQAVSCVADIEYFRKVSIKPRTGSQNSYLILKLDQKYLKKNHDLRSLRNISICNLNDRNFYTDP